MKLNIVYFLVAVFSSEVLDATEGNDLNITFI
jgi:hypothetical protein